MGIESVEGDSSYVRLLVGQTIRGVILASNSDEPRGQLFLLFDETHFEFFSVHIIHPTKALWPAQGPDMAGHVREMLVRRGCVIAEAHASSRSPKQPPTTSLGSDVAIETPRTMLLRLLAVAPRAVALLGFVAALSLMLVPPWTKTYAKPGMATVRKPAARSVLFSPPRPDEGCATCGVSLDFGRLAVELLLSGSVAAAGLFMDSKRH